MNKISAVGHLLSLKLNLMAVSNWLKGPFFYHLITMHRNIEEIWASFFWAFVKTQRKSVKFVAPFPHLSPQNGISWLLSTFLFERSHSLLFYRIRVWTLPVLSLTASSLTNSCCWDFKWCDFDWQCYLWCCHWCCWRWRYSRRQILTSYY